MDTSPSKRRVLGPIDTNSRNSPSKTQLLNQPSYNTTKRPLDQEPVLQAPRWQLLQPAKRQRTSIDGGDAQPVPEIRECSVRRDPLNDENTSASTNSDDRDSDADHQRSESPDEESSIFDNSAIDTSEATTITEPDAEVAAPTPPAPPRRQRAMTREEARIKAETLRLRLGLASYKLRTGQTDVPLDQLKVKPLPGGSGKSIRDEKDEQPSLPPLPRPWPISLSSRERGEDEQQSRPTTATRKALPSAPPSHRADSFGHHQWSSPASRRSLPELAAASLNTIRATQAVSPRSC
ncbi:hypothetical protein F5Y13DRAFT_92009 [Hypoxylon sp. FL1857]|nr:hypothetical protein F5Y13DRAFT_92009 [Hypoxylon sp. FL1857]